MSSTDPRHPRPHPRRPRSRRPSGVPARASAPCCSAIAAGCPCRSCWCRCSRAARWSRRNWILGFVLIVLGEAIRLAGVAAAGTVTRRRSRTVQRLVTYGIFAWMRNPLYVGNFLIWMGFTVISGVLWFIPVAVAAVRGRVHADRALRGGRARVDLRRGVSARTRRARRAGSPARPATDEEGEHHWGEAWRSEIIDVSAVRGDHGGVRGEAARWGGDG